MNTLFIMALVVCVVAAIVGTVLHFQMKLRLYRAGLPVKWLMWPSDDFRMWRAYLIEAPRRQWPIWPFYAYRVVYVIFAVSGVLYLMALLTK